MHGPPSQAPIGIQIIAYKTEDQKLLIELTQKAKTQTKFHHTISIKDLPLQTRTPEKLVGNTHIDLK